MTKPTMLGVKGAYCLLAALLLVPLGLSAQEAPVIEEIVVTGSYIKRDSFDSASPLTVVNQESINANATPNLG